MKWFCNKDEDGLDNHYFHYGFGYIVVRRSVWGPWLVKDSRGQVQFEVLPSPLTLEAVKLEAVVRLNKVIVGLAKQLDEMMED